MIDAHHHLWDMNKLHYPWLETGGGVAMCGDFTPLCRNYLLADYLRDMGGRVEKSVHVQADHDEGDPVAETRWLQSVADRPDSGGFPHGIVAFADFSCDDVDVVVAAHRESANLRGVRQIVAHHEDPALNHASRDHLSDMDWRRRLGVLEQYGLSFDLQCYPHQAASAAELIARYPDILFILDHAGSPIRQGDQALDRWREGMRRLAGYPNVAVKISGLGMFDHHWTVETIRPIILETIDIFGADRAMFASNFPVESLASNFERLYDAYAISVAHLPEATRLRLFSENAERLYRI